MVVQLHGQGRDLDGELGPGRRADCLVVDDRGQLAESVATQPASARRPEQPLRKVARGQTAEAPVIERLAQLRDVVAGGPFEALRERPVELASRVGAESPDGGLPQEVVDDL